jgi:hypothetical protein
MSAFLENYMVLIVIGICLCVGYVLKNVIITDKINKFIPLIMAVLGVIMNLWLNAFAFTPEILLGGLVSGLASTGMYEAFHNFLKKKGDKNAS